MVKPKNLGNYPLTVGRGNVVYSTNRIGGVKRWYLGDPADHEMRIGDNITDYVGFLCVKDSGKKGQAAYQPFGNAFIVEHPSLDETGTKYEPSGCEYLVTAKHLVEDGKKHGDIFLRLNTKDGGKDHIRITGDWHYPKDADGFESDVAAIRFNPPHNEFIYEALPSYSLLGARHNLNVPELMHGPIGLGDQLCTVGLFSGHYGQKRNVPILQFGTIAAVPDPSEPLKDKKTGKAYEAYLVEMRSIAGLSGSPVFLLVDPEARAAKRITSPIVFLLGLVRSYWYYNIDSQTLTTSSDIFTEVNVGISAVTPSQKILEILEGEDVKKEREKEKRETPDRFETKFASGIKKRAKTPSDLTRGGFEKALKRASRKVSKPESKSKSGKR